MDISLLLLATNQPGKTGNPTSEEAAAAETKLDPKTKRTTANKLTRKLGPRQLELEKFMANYGHRTPKGAALALAVEAAPAVNRILTTEKKQEMLALLLLQCACDFTLGRASQPRPQEIYKLASYAFPCWGINNHNEEFGDLLCSILNLAPDYDDPRKLSNYHQPDQKGRVSHLFATEKTNHMLIDPKERADNLLQMIKDYGKKVRKLNSYPKLNKNLQPFINTDQTQILYGIFKFLKERAYKENRLEDLVRYQAIANATFGYFENLSEFTLENLLSELNYEDSDKPLQKLALHAETLSKGTPIIS